MGSKKKALLEAISKFHQVSAVTAAVVEEPVEATKLAADPVDTDEEPIGEIQVSEYLIFTLALDTYGRYLEETSGQEDAEDELLLKGIHILRSADLQSQDDVKSFMTGHLGTEAHKKMLARAFLIRTSGAAGLSKRALQLRTILSRGGASTMRGIFQTNKALKQMREAMSASILDNADAALDVFAAIPLRNLRMAKWIDEAAALAGTGNVVLNPVSEGTKSAIDAAPDLLVKSMQELASASAEGSREADIQRTEALTQIQANAEEQARKALEKSSEEDRPLLRSEVIGVATATAVAVMTDPSNPRNIPETLKGLDDDQLAAALTDGKVSVHAGAGAGKSFSLVSRVAYLVKDRGVNPTRILVTSFNRRAADELKEKIGRSIGDSAVKLMTVDTLHSVCGGIVDKFGTPAQRSALKNRIGDGAKVMRALSKVFESEQRAAAEAGAPEESILPTPPLKQVSMFISRWAGAGTTPQEARSNAISKAETASAIIYGRYLMSKKRGYRPANPTKEWARFESSLKYPWSDFSDMITLCKEVLTQNPAAQAQASEMFDHVIVDESQDRNPLMAACVDLIQGGIKQDSGKSLWLVGDSKQCVHVDTLVETEFGSKRVGDLEVGDRIASFEASEVVFRKVQAITPSDWNSAVKVVTNDAELVVSPNHKLWCGSVKERPDLFGKTYVVQDTSGTKVYHKGTFRTFATYNDAVDSFDRKDRFADVISVNNLSVPLTRANLVRDSDWLVAATGSKCHLDKVVRVEEVKVVLGSLVDLTIEGTANFFGNGILSHNSINAFQGADSELFSELYNKEGWNTRLIKTNYRCEPEIVEAGNRLISSNPEAAMFDQVPDPKRRRGSGSVQVSNPSNEALAAFSTIESIKKSLELGGVLTENAVLCRTNNELHAYETACILRGVPYARKGAGSVFGSPETEAVLAFVDLATSKDTSKTHKALAKAIATPNKVFLKREDVEIACQAALSTYARATNSALNTLDAAQCLRSPRFKDILAAELNRFQSTQGAWLVGKNRAALNMLQEDVDSLTANMSLEPSEDMPPFTTKDMLDQILSFRGLTREDGKEMQKPFSEFIQINLNSRTGGEDGEVEEDEAEEVDTNPDPAFAKVAKLGAVGYLYALSEPDPTDDVDIAYSPTKPTNFAAKMDRYAAKAKDLRTDIKAWAKEQKGKPAKEQQPPPGVYLSTVHCSPADEPILTTNGWVAIGDLDPEQHRLASYMPSCNQLFWGLPMSGHKGPEGYGFRKASRWFQGDLITLVTEGSHTRVTPDHRLRVKWDETFYNKYVVYLMKRGDWWRVGHCKSRPVPYVSGDLAGRLATEKAEAGWILKVCDTKAEAYLEEARIQALYGMPSVTFESAKKRSHTSEELYALHESTRHVVGPRALRLLEDFQLSEEYPLYCRGALKEVGNRKMDSFTIRARNFLSGYMKLPVPKSVFIEKSGPREVWTKPDWLRATTTTAPFEGEVFSLDVVPYHFYISGGAVVHNSTKGAEWPTVYVQMPAGKFPMVRKPTPDTELNEEYYRREDRRLKDERRLGYVAVTRAMKNLRIVCPQMMGQFKAGISSYVSDAGLMLGENINPPGKADPSGMADAVDPETEVVSNNDADGLPPKTASYAEPDEGDYPNYWLDSGEF